MEDTMTYAAKTGYDCLEIAPFTISNYVTDISATERQRVKDLATKTGIEISGIHWVLVKAEGFEYEGKAYSSLSKIANDITRSRWNGWLFFGLKK